ncbi:MAG: formimidoylglutamate deiminase [Phycisphaerae bacterium]
MSATETTPVQVVEADLTLVEGVFRPGVRVAISGDGRISQVGALPEPPTNRLTRRALLPGFVNVHSHAFQRELRGHGETYPAGRGDFWSWREAMYALVERLPKERVLAVYRAAFAEMRAAGYTTVGEFHYLRHSDGDSADFALDEPVIAAAADAGVRLVLLSTFYRTGGIGKPLNRAQRRFATEDVDAFLANLDQLSRKIDPRTHSLAIAPHSIRAVPPDDLQRLFAAAADRGLPCHIHLEEQRRELDESRAALGVTPMRWVLDHTSVGANCTAIHATHADGESLDHWLASGARVCLCPITEGNLGDGVADVPRMLARDDALCIGSDSNIRLDPFEELRWLEFVQRLKAEKRGVGRRADGELALRLLRIGAANGAAALGVHAGRIAPGLAADFCTLDLDHRELRGATSETLAAHVVFGGSAACVAETCVNGQWRAANSEKRITE